jgi:type II secretory pathway component PulK
MSRNGFALLAMLWVISVLTAVAGVGMAVARLGYETTRNRILLTRAEWAREACGEILQARFAADSATHSVETIDLGRGTWCRAALDDPSGRLNLNTASPEMIAQLLRVLHVPASVVDSISSARQGDSIYDLLQVTRGDSVLATRLARFLTTRGTGIINVNQAPREVLTLLPGMSEESVDVILNRRWAQPLRSADELAGALTESSRARFLSSYAEFVRLAGFGPLQLIGTLEGGVRGTPLVARATLTIVPVPGRLAVIRRETE